MNKRVLYIMSVLLLLQMTTLMAQNNIAKEKIDIVVRQFEQKGDKLYVKFHLNTGDVKIKTQQALSYTPIIATSTKNINLPEILLRGRSNYKSYTRRIALMNKKELASYNLSAPYATIKAFGSREKQVNYEYVIPYEDWMSDSKLEIKSDIYNYENKYSLKTEVLANVTLEQKHIAIEAVSTPVIAEVVPILPKVEKGAIEYPFIANISEYEEDKKVIATQKDKNAFKIYFPLNFSRLDENYADNAEQLIYLKSVINEIQKSNDFSIAKIFITGFSSIKGRYQKNELLSYRRAKSIYDYLLSNTEVDSSMIEIYDGIENWGGLQNMVMESDMRGKDKVLNIIKNVSVRQGRELELMKLNRGRAYRYMDKHFFSQLRYAYVKIYFDTNK